MSDLISRQALIEDVRNRSYINKALAEIFETVIDSQSTVYDVDRVVEQLRENDNICSLCLDNKNSISVCAKFCDIGKRLEIVKAGGVHE